MRELNFRVWTGKEMLFFDDLANWDWKDCDEWLKIKKVAVMQSTGLKDKNGNEIFEGDIVKILHGGWASKSESDKRSLDEYLDSLVKKYEVVFIDGTFTGKRKTGSYNSWTTDNEGNVYSRLIPEKHGYIEIIGNIYKNPEFLDK